MLPLPQGARGDSITSLEMGRYAQPTNLRYHILAQKRLMFLKH